MPEAQPHQAAAKAYTQLVEIIVHEVWHSKMPSYVRKTFMTACPRINRTWKAVYAPIASQDMYIFQNSIIYHDFIPRLTRTITCFADLRANEREGGAKEVYRYLIALPNIRGFDALFPHVPYVSFRIVWIGIRQPSYVPSFSGIPIHIRYDRFLSDVPSCHCPGKTRMHIYISMIDPDSWMHESLGWSEMSEELRAVGVPEYFFCTTFFYPASYHETIRHGVRRIRQSTCIDETQLGSWDSRDINQHLWIASKGRHSLKCLSRFFYHWEFKHAQSHLPSGWDSGARSPVLLLFGSGLRGITDSRACVFASSGVVPAGLCLHSRHANKWGCLAGLWIGFACSVAAWLATAAGHHRCHNNYEQLAGNAGSFLMAAIISGIISYVWPEDFDFEIARRMKIFQPEGTDAEGHADVDMEKGVHAHNDASDDGLYKDFIFSVRLHRSIPGALCFRSLHNGNPTTMIHGWFRSLTPSSRAGFTWWIVLALLWTFIASFIVIIYPVWESRHALWEMMRGMMADMSGKRKAIG
ncbi:hypothetical protein ARMGADRAFT_1092443 [Armillaria gallica]|uniref:Uncharacterized protein n=1 Tax=Armillaria gallica TaxID=47427 RepID=A0A2H3CU35_ARMGA|nr:hypothetical protein ARMGADRAFT_1092443 [Armillaria gallica]